MTVIPKRNLPPGAEPWGRSVDSRVQSLEGAATRQAQDIGNTLSGLNGSLSRLAEQVGEIRTITQTLVEQQAVLAAQQATLVAQQGQLQEQQSTLSRTVADLSVVVNGMIRPSTRYQPRSGFSITPAMQVVVPTTATVPAGYTGAVFFATAVLFAQNPTTSNSYMYCDINFGNTPVGSSVNQVKADSWGQTTTAASWVESGLSAGQVININARAQTEPSQGQTWGNAGNRCELAVQILWLR